VYRPHKWFREVGNARIFYWLVSIWNFWRTKI